MKKGKLTLGIVLGLLIIGFVVAQAQAVSAQDDSSAAVEPFTLRAAGVFCLDQIGWCEDAKLAYQSVGGGIYSLTGYEYGCGDDVLIVGSMIVEGNTLQIGYTSIYCGGGGDPMLGQVNAQINLGTLSGPSQWAWHYDGYHCGSGTAQIIPCPVTAVVSTEPSNRG